MSDFTKKLLFSLVLYSCLAVARPANDSRIYTNIILDGEDTRVYFNDGDTFRIKEGPLDGTLVRVVGFNALETYGPVHQWRQNTGAYLLGIARRATDAAQNGEWHCQTEDHRDIYGRLLASCDDLALALIEHGLAHAYSVDEQPAKRIYLDRQQIAQGNGEGMWRNGIPLFLINSVHSASEEREPYNRMISTSDGHSMFLRHHRSYETCENVCLDEDSCMVYVPFDRRYGPNRPSCLLP